MTQIVDSLPDEYQERILCHYKNATSRVQIAQITNILHWYFERVVFQAPALVVRGNQRSATRIHTAKIASAIPALHDCLRAFASQYG